VSDSSQIEMLQLGRQLREPRSRWPFANLRQSSEKPRRTTSKMSQPLDEKLEPLQDKGGRKTCSLLPRVAAFTAVVALLVCIILIAVGAISITRQGTKPISCGDPVAPPLAANASQSQAEEQLQLWRSQVIDGGGALIVH
jgi:hypothetical protein